MQSMADVAIMDVRDELDEVAQQIQWMLDAGWDTYSIIRWMESQDLDAYAQVLRSMRRCEDYGEFLREFAGLMA